MAVYDDLEISSDDLVAYAEDTLRSALAPEVIEQLISDAVDRIRRSHEILAHLQTAGLDRSHACEQLTALFRRVPDALRDRLTIEVIDASRGLGDVGTSACFSFGGGSVRTIMLLPQPEAA